MAKLTISRLLKEAQFHGSNGIAEKTHRLFWVCILILMLCASMAFVMETVNKFLSRPTNILMDFHNQHRMDFPSVLVCPEIAYSEHKMDQFVKEINFPMTVTKEAFRRSLRQLAAFYSPDLAFDLEDLEMLETVLDYNGLTVEAAGLRLAPTCEETVLRCRLLGTLVNCSNIFRMALTQVGFCCVFNGRSLRNEVKNNGANVSARPEYYTILTGPQAALTVVVNTSQKHSDIDVTYKWVMVQSGQRYVESSMNGTPMSAGQEVWQGYGWSTYSIREDARNLDSSLRVCRLSGEKLKYFPSYQKWYCLRECEMERTHRRCGCLGVTHPQPPGFPICRAKRLDCVRHSAVTYDSDECLCQDTCDTTRSSVRIQTFKLQDNHYYDTIYQDLDYEKVGVLKVYIAGKIHKNRVRYCTYDSINLFSQLGGMFNIFLGCSIMTLLEIVQMIWYFFKNTFYNWRNGKFKKKMNEKNTKNKKHIIVKPNQGRKVQVNIQNVRKRY